MLVAHDAELEARSNHGGTPLHVAAAQGPNPLVIVALAGVDANVNARNDYGGTPLHSAAEHRDTKEPEGRRATLVATVVQTLQAVGTAVDAGDNYGRSALHRATMLNEWMPIVAALIATGMDLNLRDRNGRTALDFAQNPAVIAALRAAGARCGENSEFIDGGCTAAAQAAATSDGLHLPYRKLTLSQAARREQTDVPDSIHGPAPGSADRGNLDS